MEYSFFYSTRLIWFFRTILLYCFALTVWLGGGIAVAADEKPFDFTLPTIDGERFVRLSSTSRPILINFWGAECGPCVSELPRLQRFARDFPMWTVLLVATDPLDIAQNFLARHPLSLMVLRPGADVSRLMRLAGNSVSALPFSVGIDKNNQVCFRKIGELSEKDLMHMNLVCESK